MDKYQYVQWNDEKTMVRLASNYQRRRPMDDELSVYVSALFVALCAAIAVVASVY